MPDEMKTIASNAIKFVENFFSRLGGEQKTFLPPVFESSGTWMANYQRSALGIFFLNRASLKRVVEYQNKGLHPFPGLLTSEGGTPIAIKVTGSCNLFSSNRISNMFAFWVAPSSSFTVVNHFQEIKDPSDREFKYQVDLAFVLGIQGEEDWSSVESRLSELLNYTMDFWCKIR